MIDTETIVTDVLSSDLFGVDKGVQPWVMQTSSLNYVRDFKSFAARDLLDYSMISSPIQENPDKFDPVLVITARAPVRDGKRFEVGEVKAFNGSDANYSAVTSEKRAWQQYWG